MIPDISGPKRTFCTELPPMISDHTAANEDASYCERGLLLPIRVKATINVTAVHLDHAKCHRNLISYVPS